MVSEKSPPFPPTAIADLGRLHRSSSEWAFEWFLREATISDPAGPSSDLAGDDDVKPTAAVEQRRPLSPAEDQGAFLRRQLNAACAAYAIPREASGLKNEVNSPLSDK